MAGRSDLVDVEVILRRESDLAWGLASPDDPYGLIWVPKSESELELTSHGPHARWTLTCPEWLAIAKGLV